MDEPVKPTPPPGAPDDPGEGSRPPGSEPSARPHAARGPGSGADPANRSEARSAEAGAPSVARPRRRRARIALAAAIAVLGAAVLGLLAAGGGWYEAQLRTVAAEPAAADAPTGAVTAAAGRPPEDDPALAAISSAVARAELEARPDSPYAVLPASFPELAPRGVYIVVDTRANRLRLYRRGELLREAVCSTGSGTVLKDPVGGRTWIFDTPLGERRVQRKTRNPVWIKPDWAFVEDGYEPPRNFRQRVDDVSLGRYGLYLGDGYIIHGTLFQTLLGRPLTHGCIRLGNEDLEYVYEQTPVGARVFLY